MEEPSALFSEHVAQVTVWAREALARCEGRFEGVVLHAGAPALYHADDQAVPFRPVPHFARFAPLAGPHHLVVVRGEGRPRLVRVAPRDFWHEPPAPAPLDLEEALEVTEVDSPEAAREAVGSARGLAYVGSEPALAESLGLPKEAVQPQPLVAALDWYRATKTPFEVACLREAARLAGRGHAAARAAAAARASELEVHLAYLAGAEHLERELPYETIVAWDEAAAILHSSSKRRAPPRPGQVFLIDAGATFLGYCSDVTRTYAGDAAPPLFREALARLTDLQEALVAAVRPGLPFVDLHERAFRGVAEILVELGVLRTSVDDACARELPRPFFPHGLGHHLGLQVHDVGGKQQDVTGAQAPPPERYPWLRTTRTLEAGQVVTIEPGLYFIPLLLEPLREGPHAADVDWARVEALLPCGGIRVEDDVHVTAQGPDNLSRPFASTDFALSSA